MSKGQFIPNSHPNVNGFLHAKWVISKPNSTIITVDKSDILIISVSVCIVRQTYLFVVQKS